MEPFWLEAVGGTGVGAAGFEGATARVGAVTGILVAAEGVFARCGGTETELVDGVAPPRTPQLDRSKDKTINVKILLIDFSFRKKVSLS